MSAHGIIYDEWHHLHINRTTRHTYDIFHGYKVHPKRIFKVLMRLGSPLWCGQCGPHLNCKHEFPIQGKLGCFANHKANKNYTDMYYGY